MKKILIVSACICATSAWANKLDTLKTYQLESVQVTAIKAKQNTPMAFSNLNAQQIKRLNAGKDIPQLLSLLPSVTFTSDAGNGIGYTTMRVRGTDPSRINITANGIPMNDAESSSLFWVNMADFASSVSTIQLQRGVGTSTNGAGAFGATLNMQTENIGAKPMFELDASGGSYGSHKETLRFSTGLLGSRWGVQGRLSNIYSDGYLDRATTSLQSYFVQAGYFSDRTMVKFITFNGKEQTYHAWNYASKELRQKYGRTYNPCGEYQDADKKTHYYDNQTDNYHQQNYQLHWNEIANNQLHFSLALHYTKGNGYYEEYKDERYLIEYAFKVDGDVLANLVRQKHMSNDFYGAVASVNYDNYKGLQANIGGGWNKYNGNHFGKVLWVGNDRLPIGTLKESEYALAPDHTYYNNHSIKTDGNIYAKVHYALWQGLSVYADLQYRHVGIKMHGPADAFNWEDMKQMHYDMQKTYNFFNPKCGLSYNIAPQHRAYISYAIANKEPVRNNFENNLNGSLEEPRAERLNDLEVGYQFKGKKTSASANFYHMYYKDQFVLTGEIDKIGEPITRNMPKSYRMGIELQAAWQPTNWFRWDANTTLSKNKVADISVQLANKTVATIAGETTLAFSPSVIANNIFSLIYKGFDASIHTQYIGKQYLTNTGIEYFSYTNDADKEQHVSMMLGEKFNTNLDFSYQFALKKTGIKNITVGCTLYNLLNAMYDNNGWAAPSYRKDADNRVVAFAKTGDAPYLTGFAPSAPLHFMTRCSINF